MPKTVLNIAVVDEFPAVREWLCTVLSTWQYGRVVLQVVDGVAYEVACATAPPIHLTILDLLLPNRDGYTTLEWMQQHQPDTKALVYTAHPTDAAVRRALERRAGGVVCKSMGAAELLAALEDLRLSGFHRNALVQRLFNSDPANDAPSALRAKAMAEFSDRQLEFLLLYIANDHPTMKVVAERMKLKLSSVETHRKAVVEKTGVSQRHELRDFAVRFDLI